MRELVYYVAVSLDGRICGPGDDFSGFLDSGDHMEVISSEWADTLPTAYRDLLGIVGEPTRFDTVLMGWNTYALGLPLGVDSPYRHLRQLVVSRRHAGQHVGEGIEVVSDDPIALVRRLKQHDSSSDIWLCGGGILAGQLLDEIDRLVLKVNPLVLGDGPSLVAGAYLPTTFERVASRSFDSGVIIQELVRHRA